MKIRLDFVTNSSSSSYLVARKVQSEDKKDESGLSPEQQEKITKLLAEQINEDWAEDAQTSTEESIFPWVSEKEFGEKAQIFNKVISSRTEIIDNITADNVAEHYMVAWMTDEEYGNKPKLESIKNAIKNDYEVVEILFPWDDKLCHMHDGNNVTGADVYSELLKILEDDKNFFYMGEDFS